MIFSFLGIAFLSASLCALSYLSKEIQVYWTRHQTARTHGCEAAPSVPRWDPIFGLDLAVKMLKSYNCGNRGAVFRQQHEALGETFQQTSLGTTRLFTINPDILRTVFSTNFTQWGVEPLRLPIWKPLIGAGVMSTDAAHWKLSRGLVQPLFRRDNISNLSSYCVHVDRVFAYIPGDCTTVDLQPLFSKLVLDFTTEFLFGVSVESLTRTPDKDAMAFLNAFQRAQAEMGKRTQLPFMSFFGKTSVFQRSCDEVRNITDRYIIAAVDRCTDVQAGKVPEKYILADELVKRTADRDHIRSQLLNTFLAAHDTTPVLLTNTFFNLARYPHIYDELRHELLALPTIPTSFEGLKKLRCLWNIVLETSRLTPVVGQSARIALEDTVLPTGGGSTRRSPIFVKKGTVIQFNYSALHRRTKVFGDDANFFRPSRWNKLAVSTWEYLPFIGGPRVCPAQHMALMQACFTIAKIVQRFRSIENRDLEPEFIEEYRIHQYSKNGCKVALKLT